MRQRKYHIQTLQTGQHCSYSRAQGSRRQYPDGISPVPALPRLESRTPHCVYAHDLGKLWHSRVAPAESRQMEGTHPDDCMNIAAESVYNKTSKVNVKKLASSGRSHRMQVPLLIFAYRLVDEISFHQETLQHRCGLSASRILIHAQRRVGHAFHDTGFECCCDLSMSPDDSARIAPCGQ